METILRCLEKISLHSNQETLKHAGSLSEKRAPLFPDAPAAPEHLLRPRPAQRGRRVDVASRQDPARLPARRPAGRCRPRRHGRRRQGQKHRYQQERFTVKSSSDKSSAKGQTEGQQVLKVSCILDDTGNLILNEPPNEGAGPCTECVFFAKRPT